ncbi:MAG TPA: alpha/beta fold hydrolase [Chloroflexota bacterium]|nr:alpha/beta fold hydrolase [Chloroflexota bacterium]
MPFAAAADTTRLYFEEHGAGEPLVLISGQGSDHHMWDPIREDFAARYRVIVFDHRGTGESEKPTDPSGYSMHRFASDVITILDHLRIERAHAYGLSMGGRICQWLGIEHGSRLGALVLGCTTPGNAHGVRRPAEVNAMMANRSTDPEEALKFYLDPFVSPAWAKAHPEYLATARHRVRHPIPRFAQRFHYQASEAHDAWNQLSWIHVPALVIHGSEDQINPAANAPLLAERIAGAELHIIQAGRHGYFLEFHEEASRVVLEFLARHPIMG